jgi:hypothetical protein
MNEPMVSAAKLSPMNLGFRIQTKAA